MRISNRGMAVLMGLTVAAVHAPLQAQGFFGDMFADVGVDFSGFIRAEGTYKTTSDENLYNQPGNVFNDRTVQRTPYAPPNLTQNQIDNLGLGGLINVGEVGTWNTVPLAIFNDEVRRGDIIQSQTNDTNYTILRAQGEMNLRFSRNFRFVAKPRALYDPGIYNDFDARSVEDVQSGISGGDPALYHGEVNYFEYRVEDGSGGFTNGNPLEFSGRNYFVDFPALLFEYTDGPMTLRVGNQQIAWGQAIFFRVLDVPNGLDLRRHSILDRSLEEFSDKRVPMLSARLTYQLPFSIIADAYAGRFQPTVFGNPNTSFNVIPVQFTVRDMFKEGGFDDKYSYGLRLRADYGSWGWQAIAVRRWNPDGTFRWTKSGVNQSLEGGGLGATVNAAYALNPRDGCGGTTGEALAETAFEVAPGGVYSAEEWFTYAAEVRLSGIEGLNASIEDFDCAQALNASTIDPNDADAQQQAENQLDTFFVASGGSLRGHIAREYHQENVFGLGVNYVTTSSIDFLNQIIINLEVSYQPKRAFTDIALRQDPLIQDETTAALIMDKWHRFAPGFPGTYMVFQALWKNRSDLVGRHLSGYGATPDNGLPPGVNNATYLVFGFQQPLPNRIFDIEFASLYDPRGGLFMQPMLRWNPGNNIGVEAFYNFIDGELSGNPNDNVLSTLGFADELGLRLTYQF